MKVRSKQCPGFTKQREVVLAVIKGHRDHMTANEVFAEARTRLPTISFATVYNSLRFLKEAGHIAEIQFGNGAARYDRMTSRHDHALCTECGDIVDIEIEPAPELIKAAAACSRFQPESLEFTLKGICPDCFDKDRR